MTSRRQFLHHAAAAAAAAPFATHGLLAQQQQAKPPADAMDAATRPDRAFYAPPDFGPAPTVLPPETLALRGVNSLRTHAEQQGLMVGAAIAPRMLAPDSAIAELVADQFSLVVSENSMKWMALRPAAGKFDFTQADALVEFATAHKMSVRGHTLVWHNSVPPWLEKDTPKSDVRKLLTDHIRTVVGRYKGRIQSWDVVNEAILPKDDQPGGLRKSFWYDAVGPDYIDLAFHTARNADPHAKLTYNDYSVEMDSPGDEERRVAILGLLRGMKSRGVPLDAVGIQSHIKAASSFTVGKGLTDYLNAIQAMGLEIYLTEMDVNEDDIASNDVSVRDAQVAQTYSDFLHVALANPAVKSMLTWGVTDRFTWLNSGPTHHRKQPDRPQRSLLFDPQYRPTPAFFAVRDSIDARFKKTTALERPA